MDKAGVGERETFETVGEGFPELDEAARRRVAARMAAGADARAAFAQETVALQLVGVYN